MRKSCASKNIYAHLRIYSKETKTMEHFLVGFCPLGIFSYIGSFPDGILSSEILSSWDFFLWGFYLMGFFPTWDFVLMGFFPRTISNIFNGLAC